MNYNVANLIQLATTAKENCYCPYSKYPVGAALVTETGEVFTGCNVENACFNCGICAERTAICKAVSDGYTAFIAVVVITNKDKKVKPCGMCRQMLNEFSKDMIVYSASSDGSYDTHKLSELLPESFGSNDLCSNYK